MIEIELYSDFIKQTSTKSKIYKNLHYLEIKNNNLTMILFSLKKKTMILLNFYFIYLLFFWQTSVIMIYSENCLCIVINLLINYYKQKIHENIKLNL